MSVTSKEALIQMHADLQQEVERVTALLQAFRELHANEMGAYPVGTEVVWIRPPSGAHAIPGQRWGRIAEYHFAKWGSLVAQVETRPKVFDNDSHWMVRPVFNYGTVEEYRAHLEREIARVKP